MANTHNLLKQIYVKSAVANVDYLYGPWASVEEACANIPIARRKRGLTVGIETEIEFEEYQWKYGIADEDLVPKVKKELPELSYYNDIRTIKAEIGQDIHLVFKFTSPNYGQCTITIYDSNGLIVKQVKVDKGVIDVNIGAMSMESTYIYRISGIDALTIPADDIELKVIIGGVKINCDFGDRIEQGINTSTELSTIFSASSADTSKVIKVLGEIRNSNGDLAVEPLNITGTNPIYSITTSTWDIGIISQWDTYTLTMWAYTGSSPNDTSEGELSTSISYKFALLNANDFVLTSTKTEITSNTNANITIPFIIESGNTADLRAHGEIYHATVIGDDWTISGEPISEYTLDRQPIRVNTTNYWAIGKIITPGTYLAKMWATTIGGESSLLHEHILIKITIEQYHAKYSIETEGLEAEFTAQGHSNNRDSDKLGIWTNNVIGSDVYFELHDLNYSSNGWKNVDESLPDSEDAEKMLKFTGDSYGILKNSRGNYNPLSKINSSTGFTAEIIYRTRCIGDLNTKVMTSHYGADTNSAGYSASYEYVTVGPTSSQIKYEVNEDEWIHATLVIDKERHILDESDPNYDVQNYAPEPLVTVYINGSMCSSFILTDQMEFNNIQNLVLLNSAFNTAANKIDFFGSCEIKAIRFYNKALLSSQVVNNYIASIYSDEEKERIDGRNKDVLPTVTFININNEWPRTQKEIDDEVQLVDFATLNTVKDKKLQKKRIVHAKAIYRDPNSEQEDNWTYCVVQTQGTSSLAYPVKNYKITLYKDPDMKKKDKISTFSYLGWQKESKFTLKCDYMEAAHLNNTPSCIFYNNMIDTLVNTGDIANGWTGTPFEEGSTYDYTADKRTPSRRDGMFDAIKGFPCTVTYFESTEEYESGQSGIYVGTYMFNIDKSGDSLGFKAPARLDSDGKTELYVNNPRINTSDYEEYDSALTYSKDDCVAYDGDVYKANANEITGEWDSSKWDIISKVKNIMQSFEGVANKSNSAGCFYSFEDYKASAYHDDYCQTAYLIYKDVNPDLPTTLDEFIEAFAGKDIPFVTNYTKESEYKREGTNDLYLKDEAHYEIPYKNEYEYFAADYEARYDWDDLEEGGEEFWGNENWGVKRMIDWVSSASKDLTRFRNEFSNYFDLEYCILYYLQMIVFGQVDNAGKNSMWDTWDGLIWRPRPYDLDTATGLNNSGFEEIKENAELIKDLSPFINQVTSGVGGYSDDVAANANSRYETYNTRTSKFWLAFAKAFDSQIANMYGKLRNSGIYTMDNIVREYIGNTSDIIGEVYYNRDMVTKFYKLSGNIADYISRMHGNRVQKFKSWMRKRLVFCDTLFDYTNNTDSLNTMIELRSDAYTSGAPVSVYVSVQTYSPQYVKVDVGSTRDALLESYCAPDSEYINPNTGTIEKGLLFRLPLVSGNKEIKIFGAGNIRVLGNMYGLKASSLVLGGATKLTSLDVSGSNKLVALSLSKNKYLQTLDCSNCVQLGTDASGSQLDISNCLNLKEVNLNNTKLISVAFPEGGALKTVSASNTNITGIRLVDCQFLTDINVTNCEHILSYEIDNCPSMTAINADYLPITSFSIANCANISSISLVGCNSIRSGNFRISNCPALSVLNFSSNSSPALKVLNLTTVNGLTELNISGSQSIETIVFSPTIGNEFKVFTLKNSTIKNVSYDQEAEGIDMSRLTGLTSLSFQDCTKVEHIFGINYIGNCSSLFRNCASLIDVKGTFETTSSASYMFYSCKKLQKISEAIFNFTNCNSLAWTFAQCYALPLSEVKYMFDSCSNELKDINSVCREKVSTNYTDDAYTKLPTNFFGNLKGVTGASYAFYYSGVGGDISINAFKDASGNNGFAALQNATGLFYSNSRITSIPGNILSCMPNIVNASYMFASNSNMTLSLPLNFFSNTPNITSIRFMFSGSSKVSANIGNLQNLLQPLSNLTNAGYLFNGCFLITGTVPAGFFANNSKLTTVSGCFRQTGISGLPATGNSLFRSVSDTSTNKLYLTSASGLFYNCKALIGTIPGSLMAGAINVTNIGDTYEGDGSTQSGGIFEGCTGITRFGEDFFNQMPNLTNISKAFSGCTSLIGVPYNPEDPNEFPAKILKDHTKLNNVSGLFNGCTSLNIRILPNLFEHSKNTLINASNIFQNCVNIQSFSNDIFSNMPNLTTVSGAFKGCIGMDLDVSELNVFDGDIKLQDVSNLFEGCIKLHGVIPTKLFDSCRDTLTNVSYMFYNCVDSTGLPENNINGIEAGNEDIVTSINAEINRINTEKEAAIERGEIIDEDDYILPIVPTLQLGLLAECTKLKNTKYMFANCYFIKDKIPYDVFWTSNIEREYSLLEDTSYMFFNCNFNAPIEYDGTNYLIHPDFFVKLSRVKNISFMFGKNYAATNPSNYPKWSGSYPIHQLTFYNMYALTAVRGLFTRCYGLGGAVTNQWFINSMNTITDAQEVFAYTNITSIAADFLRINTASKNNKLLYVSHMLYNCNKITGTIPPMNNPMAYSRIDLTQSAGYMCYCYNCINANNYSSFDPNTWAKSDYY